jgi:hypothetical protein
MISEIRKIIAEKGLTGRFSTWPVPMAMSFIRSGSDYAVKWINGEITEKFDMEALKQCFVEDTGVDITFTLLEQDGVTYDNYIMCLCDYLDL